MKLRKKIVSIALCLCLCLAIGSMCARATAADDLISYGQCGINVFWKLNQAGTLTITATGTSPFNSGAMFDNSITERPAWYRYRQQIKTIIVEDGVTKLGAWSFANCIEVTNVSIPASVWSVGNSAFFGCSKLSAVDMQPESIEFGRMAFSGCTVLPSIIIPKTAAVTNCVFIDCPNLTAACFRGSAPSLAADAFEVKDEQGNFIKNPKLTLYYIEGENGWTTPTYGGYPTAVWDGKVVPHEHDYHSSVTMPTCTEQGFTTYTCNICGDSYKDNSVEALGHSYENWICTRCGTRDPNAPIEFNDVPANAWYKSAVDYAVANKLMNGVGNGKFDPDGSMTRAMLVTVLWRYAGSPKEGTNTFTDVPDGQWYTDAVMWAAHNGVVSGVGNNQFAPNANITREQMAAILYRYAASVNADTTARSDLSTFPDASGVSTWANDALSWAVANQIITGSQVGSRLFLSPQSPATRAQVSAILMRFIESATK